jgi:hypothetical protein
MKIKDHIYFPLIFTLPFGFDLKKTPISKIAERSPQRNVIKVLKKWNYGTMKKYKNKVKADILSMIISFQTPKSLFLFSSSLTSFSKESKSSPFILYIMKRVAPTYHARKNMPYIKCLARKLRGCIFSSYSSVIRLR